MLKRDLELVVFCAVATVTHLIVSGGSSSTLKLIPELVVSQNGIYSERPADSEAPASGRNRDADFSRQFGVTLALQSSVSVYVLAKRHLFFVVQAFPLVDFGDCVTDA